ncbi:MAG: Zn-dependent hydrolase [Anaerolineales bacterium]|nr:Zn-dependent hydrolase [Anaerolineales bacterium]
MQINSQRFHDDFEALAQIGASGDGGVHRPSFSEAHLAARAWLRGRIQEAGLEFRQDAAGNHSATLACGPAGARTLLLGSHLDSTPHGGRFDGALGVLAALETLRTLQEAGLQLPVHLEAIDFSDEEGTLVGLLGSSALAGTLKTADLERPRGGREALLAGLARAGLSENDLLEARRDPQTLAGYLELHIEQGPRLAQAGAQVGVVTAIVGICSYRLTFAGRADHAGTTPMAERRDAAQGAAAFTLAARQIVLEQFPGCVANVGAIQLKPGAFNIVPERAELSLEFRAPQAATFERLEAALLDSARQQAGRFGLGLEVERLGAHQPTPMSAQAQAAIAAAAGELGLSHMPLPSGAGHDAQMLAALCPAGMIFIPSQGGASHSPREFSEWQDCVNGANVLLGAAIRMAGKG